MDWSKIAGAGVGAVSSAIGMIGQRARENRSNKQTEKLMGMQNQYQRGLNQQGHDLQMDMWNKTNAAAQRKHLEEAGLNVGLMYGQGGAGGATAGSQGGGSAGMGQATQPQQMNIGNVMEDAMRVAQMELMKSQAGKLDAEKDKISGVDTKEGETRIDKMVAETTNERLKGALIEYQTTAENMKGEVLWKQSQKLWEETEKLFTENEILKATKDDVIEGIKLDTINKEIDGRVKEEGITLSEEKREEIKQSIMQKWVGLGIKGLGEVAGLVTKGLSNMNKPKGSKTETVTQGPKGITRTMKRTTNQ